jgi:NitT/TauT family transport system permease protein
VLWSLIPSKEFPSLIEIASAWNVLATQQGLLIELKNSALTIISAIFLSSVISITLTVLSTAALFKPVIGWMTGFRFLGFAGITFLFTMWTSSGNELKLALLTFGMSAFLLTNSLSIVDGITQEEIDYAKTLKISGWRLSYEVVLRGKLDQFLDQIRQNAAIGWSLLSMVEGLVQYEGGVGAMLLKQNKHLHLAAVFAIQITILLYGISQDWVLKFIREMICPYVKLEHK